MGDENKEWFSNKEIYSELIETQKEFTQLRSELKETRTIIKQYNGLREEIHEINSRVDEMEAKEAGKKSAGEAVKGWSGWIVAILTFIILLINFFVGG